MIQPIGKLTAWQQTVLDEVRGANESGLGFTPANHINGQRRRRYYQTLRALERRELVEHKKVSDFNVGYWVPKRSTPSDVASGLAVMTRVPGYTCGFASVERSGSVVQVQTRSGQRFSATIVEDGGGNGRVLKLEDLNPHRIIAQRHGRNRGAVLYKYKGEPGDEWTQYAVWMVATDGTLYGEVIEQELMFAVSSYQDALNKTHG